MAARTNLATVVVAMPMDATLTIGSANSLAPWAAVGANIIAIVVTTGFAIRAVRQSSRDRINEKKAQLESVATSIAMSLGLLKLMHTKIIDSNRITDDE